MSRPAGYRGVFSGSLADLGILERGTLGCLGSQGRVQGTFCLPSSSVFSAASPSELLSLFHPGVGCYCCCRRFAAEGYYRTSVLQTQLLQPLFSHAEGHGRLEACRRSFSPQPFRHGVPFLNGGRLCLFSSVCALGTGWYPSTFRMPTFRFLSIRNLVGTFDFV